MKLKKILFDEGTVKQLAESFSVTRAMVYNALNGDSTTQLALNIRHRAIQLGLREKGEEIVTILTKKT